MKELFIGEVIKKRRKELGLTQEELCEGICEPSTISRIESGRQVPAKNKLDALLQRLGLPGERYYALMSKDEMEISNLKEKVISCNVARNAVEGLRNLDKLEALTAEDDHLLRQFILRSRIFLGYIKEGKVCPYTLKEKKKMLQEAIRLTIPDFDEEEINKNIYTVEEIKVINLIALTYSDAGQNRKAIDIYYQLLKYMKGHIMSLSEANRLIVLICYNCSRSLYFEKRYEESIEIANMGVKTSIEERYSGCFGGLFSILGHAYYAEEKFEDSKQCFYQSYYMYTIIRDEEYIQLAAKNLKDFFDIEV
ncbi:helix-turn-helix domain-containing protein [Blautia sp.]|uniref:helix-turn-helix domain-containing protein n=1 Tax=Blautia sp. TaxID=1955243 RepID=UPI002E789C8F|nr:helix-turn-helix domain-containing protein [Blautia sp.]MEE0811795.1 helix-turn-helix domain-containing protein [Blautia sp.]